MIGFVCVPGGRFLNFLLCSDERLHALYRSVPHTEMGPMRCGYAYV